MSVHYKFKSALDYDTVTFDGLHISVGDLKAAISQQKRIGKTSDFDLEITNAQTKEVYSDDHTLIPKNTSLLVARVPQSQLPKKQWESSNSVSAHKDVAPSKGLADLSRMEGSEQDKINAMISQSTFDYDPSNYQKIRGQNQRGIVPTNYTCYKCQKRGHWIKDCPTGNSAEPVEIKRSTGIPLSFMVPVEGPKAPGAMMTPSGTFAVPAVDRDAYIASESAGGADTPANAPAAPDTNVPDELICSLCRDLLTDAVMIPCCGNSFCDECIRGALLESEDHECPDCREKEIAPTTLIPNRFLRNSVASFRNQTGYSRKMPHRPSAGPPQRPQPEVGSMQQPNGPPGSLPDQPMSGLTRGYESDGSTDDNITVTVPPALVHGSNAPPIQTRANMHRPPPPRYGPPHGVKPPGIDGPRPVLPLNVPPPRLDDQRSGTPTVDERRDPSFNRGPLPPFVPGHPPRPGYNRPPYIGVPPTHIRPPFPGRFPLDPVQPPPPGIKDSPPANGAGPSEDPLEAFNRMIREKEMRAKRREEERRRMQSGSRSPRSRSRSPRPVRVSPRPVRGSPRPVRVSPRPVRTSPRPVRSSPRPVRESRSRSPRPRLRTPPPRVRYSRSRSPSPRTRGRRSPPWSPRRRRSRERSVSLSRSPSPRRRHRSPLRFRSPLRSPPRASHSPHRAQPRNGSPHRYTGLYDDMLSPPRRSVEPPYPPRYGPRINGPPQPYPPGGPVPGEPPPGFRRYDAPPFDDVPPGVDPPVPGFEPPGFEKPLFGPPGTLDRPPAGYRDPGFRPPYVEGHPGFRDMPPQPVQNEIPVIVGEPPRYRENFRPGPPGMPYREPGQVPFRDPAQPYRDMRGGPPQFRDGSYRNGPYRDGPPPHGFRDGPVPFNPDQPPANFDPNFRDDRDHSRPGYRPSNRNRGGARRPDYDRHRDREIRDRERYNENRDPERARDPDRRAHDKAREDRSREYRDREVDRERDGDRFTPERKARSSPKKSRDNREKRRSESRGRSKDKERDKKERVREKTSAERSKDKEKKTKDKKKKKREKDTDKEKKKKKKEKKIKKEDDDGDKSDTKEEYKDSQAEKEESDPDFTEKLKKKDETATNIIEAVTGDKIVIAPLMKEELAQPTEDLYGGEATEAVDKEIMQNYVKAEEENKIPFEESNVADNENKDEPFDGIELQAPADELELKGMEGHEKEMLAPLPALSKWEVDEENNEKGREPGEISSPEPEESSKIVTSEVIKRAENALFSKNVTTMKPIEIKKIGNDRGKIYGGDKLPKSSIQITVPVAVSDHGSAEFSERKRKHSKTPPPRLSVKERLGGKVDVHKSRERVVHSAVRVKSRSKTPSREKPYRRVTVDMDRCKKVGSKEERRVTSEIVKTNSVNIEDQRKKSRATSQEAGKRVHSEHRAADRERKKSTLDEAHFEPDYDENVESENESKKRENDNPEIGATEVKKPKIEQDTIKLDLANVKKKPDTESESSSESDDSSSSSEARKKKKKRKKSKKKRKRAASDSDSDSSSSDDHKKKKKKHKHKKKSSKKKKKSKHK